MSRVIPLLYRPVELSRGTDLGSRSVVVEDGADYPLRILIKIDIVGRCFGATIRLVQLARSSRDIMVRELCTNHEVADDKDPTSCPELILKHGS